MNINPYGWIITEYTLLTVARRSPSCDTFVISTPMTAPGPHKFVTVSYYKKDYPGGRAGDLLFGGIRYDPDGIKDRVLTLLLNATNIWEGQTLVLPAEPLRETDYTDEQLSALSDFNDDVNEAIVSLLETGLNEEQVRAEFEAVLSLAVSAQDFREAELAKPKPLAETAPGEYAHGVVVRIPSRT